VRQGDDGLKANRRIFFDFTISPPKSVSVVALIRDARIVKLHEQAVRKTLLELEKRAEARIRRAGQNGQRITGNLVVALFRHETSRELDPQLHTHCVVMNATFDQVENRWKALHPVAMYQAHRFAPAYYRHELAKGLRGLGYEIENHAKGFEIRGVSRSVIERFSKRHQQIEQEIRDRLAKGEVVENIKDLRERIAHGNRRRKVKNSTAERLRETWRNEMTPDERSSLNSLRSASIHEGQEVNLADTLIWSEALVFDRRAVVFEHELMAAALERSRGQNFDLPELRAAIAERDYVREKGTERLTSREVLTCELQVVVAARDGRGRHEALNRDHVISPTLSAEQTTAVAKILQSRDFITLFRSAAGTGKSFTLKEVHLGLLAVQRPVTILAPQRQQVQDLKADGLPATTLSEVLMTRKITPRSVVILDEAGQVGARQLAQLVALIKAQNGRLILSGDTRQHGAVAASDALRAIEKHSGLKPAILKSIRRQDPRLALNAEERLQIRAYRAAVKLASEGKPAESFAALDQLGWIKEVSEQDRRGLLANEYLTLIERKQRALVVAQTRAEVAEINETIRAQLLDRKARTVGCHRNLCSRRFGRGAKTGCPILSAEPRRVLSSQLRTFQKRRSAFRTWRG
jgi:conjugative relaxase-like TrwC/TraI family protein